MEIRDAFGEFLPGLDLQRTRDAFAKYVELRWPYGRRKAVAKEYDLSDDEARSVCTGRMSWQTWDKVVRHKRGGWSVLLPVYGALLNESAGQFIQREKARHVEHAQRLGSLARDLRAGGAARLPPAADLDRERPQRRRYRGG